MDIQAIGVMWFSRKTWEALLPHFDDKAALPQTYKAWLDQAEKQLTKAKKIYPHEIIKIHTNPDDFLSFCRNRGGKIDSSAREDFAAFRVAGQKTGH